MIGQILNSVLQECKAFLQSEGSGAQTMLKTNFKLKGTPDRNMPFVLIDLQDAPETFMYPGGLTMCGWKFSMNSYAYEPDSYIDDPTGYSAELLYDPIDTIRRHFSIGPLGNGIVNSTQSLTPGKIYQVGLANIVYNTQTLTPGTYFTCNDTVTTFTTTSGGYCIGTSWMTQGMADIFNEFAFCFTLSGITTAEQIDDSGLLMGYRVDFDSVSLDNATLFTTGTILDSFTELPLNNSQWILATNFWRDIGTDGQPTSWQDQAQWQD